MVYMTMLITKVYLVKPAIIIKPKIESARHSISVARAPHLESFILVPINYTKWKVSEYGKRQC